MTIRSLDFSATRQAARQMSEIALRHSIEDCKQAALCARAIEREYGRPPQAPAKSEGYYMDEASVYAQELRSREAEREEEQAAAAKDEEAMEREVYACIGMAVMEGWRISEKAGDPDRPCVAWLTKSRGASDYRLGLGAEAYLQVETLGCIWIDVDDAALDMTEVQTLIARVRD